jgi:predicted nucleotidyltransferase
MITDLSRLLGIPLATVSDEVSRLIAAELLQARKVGRSNLVRSNSANRLLSPLTDIFLATMGPHLVVQQAFADVKGVHRVLIYGSWDRYRGEPGPPPNDLDVLIVGNPARADVYQAADAVEQRTGLAVNPVIASVKRWNDETDALITQIKSSPDR